MYLYTYLQAGEELQEGLEEKLRQAEEAKEHVEQRMALLEKERQDLLEENIKITEESNNLVSWSYLNHLMTKPATDLCAQQRLRSAWAFAQSDQSLHCPYEETLGP